MIQFALACLIVTSSIDELTLAQRQFLDQLVSDRTLMRMIDYYFVGDYELPIRAEDREGLRLIKQQVDQEAHEIRVFLERLPVSRNIRESLISSTRIAHADQFVARTSGVISPDVKLRVGQLYLQEKFVFLIAEDRRFQEILNLSATQREKIVRLARPKDLFDRIEERLARGEPAGYVPAYNVSNAARRDADSRSTLTSVHIFDLLDDRQKEISIALCGEYKPGSWLEYAIEREKKPEDGDASVEDRK